MERLKKYLLLDLYGNHILNTDSVKELYDKVVNLLEEKLKEKYCKRVLGFDELKQCCDDIELYRQLNSLIVLDDEEETCAEAIHKIKAVLEFLELKLAY